MRDDTFDKFSYRFQDRKLKIGNHRTPEALLRSAAAFREADIVLRLLEGGVNPNARDQRGRTPLLYLVDSDEDFRPNKVPIMKLLLAHGADPNAADKNGTTPLHNTYHFWDLEECHAAIDLLIQSGADPNKPDVWGQTPLYELFDCETLRVLIGYGTAVNHTDNTGASPLFYASFFCGDERVETLLSFGADPNLCNHKGKSPLHCAADDQGFHPALKALLQAGSHPHHSDEDGNSPLHVAASVHAFESVQLLLEAGADINAKNRQGMTALTLVEQEINLSHDKKWSNRGPFRLSKDLYEDLDLYADLDFSERKSKMLTLLRHAGEVS